MADTIISGVTIFFGGVLLAVFGLFVSRRVISISALDSHHEVAGFIFGTVGVIYAVLLAFVVVVVWEEFESAKVAVSSEANHLANIGRLAEGLEPPASDLIRREARNYAQLVVFTEFPAMRAGDESLLTAWGSDPLWRVIRDFTPQTVKEQVIYAEMISQMDDLGSRRRARLHAGFDNLPWLMWVLLVGGGMTTVGFTYLFRIKMLRAQVVMTVALAGVTAFVLYLILALDNPFRGVLTVSSDPVKYVLERLDRR